MDSFRYGWNDDMVTAAVICAFRQCLHANGMDVEKVAKDPDLLMSLTDPDGLGGKLNSQMLSYLNTWKVPCPSDLDKILEKLI